MVPRGAGVPVDQFVDFEGLPDYVRDRWPAAAAAAQRKVDAATPEASRKIRNHKRNQRLSSMPGSSHA
jgi:hypothetical protein